MARVLVTGATGYIGGHTILALLDEGHEVCGTVRSLSSRDTLFENLSRYAGREISFDLVAAQLDQDEGWAEAVEGCEFVQHLASPIPATIPKDPNELIVPARDGALRVLRAAKAAGVSRVVMTSSMAAIGYGDRDQRPETVDETRWSNSDDLVDNTPYTRSKTIAERAAWDYIEGDGAGLELATINPVAVLGPVFSKNASASVEIVSQPMSGKLPAVPNVGFQIVDVRDTARAHVLAMTNPEAAGERFLVGSDFYWFMEVADVLREAYPDRKLPKRSMPDWLLRLFSHLNAPLKQVVPELNQRRFGTPEKAQRVLGWTNRPGKESILDTAESLIAHGAV